MKNILNKTVNALSSMTNAVNNINKIVTKNILTLLLIADLNNKIDLLSGNFRTYLVDWNDFGLYDCTPMIDYDVAKKYLNFKVSYFSKGYNRNPLLALKEGIDNDLFGLPIPFNLFFGYVHSCVDDGHKLHGSICLLKDAFGNTSNQYPTGFFYNKSTGTILSLSKMVRSENVTTFINYGYYIVYFKLIDPTGKLHYAPAPATYWCLTLNAKILMADYTLKLIKDVLVDDLVMTINQKTGLLLPQKVFFNSKVLDIYYDSYDIWHFELNYVVETVKNHRFFNIDRQAYIHMSLWQIGERVRTFDGKALALLKHLHVEKRTKAYTIKAKNASYIANGMITGTRFAKPITPFDK